MQRGCRSYFREHSFRLPMGDVIWCKGAVLQLLLIVGNSHWQFRWLICCSKGLVNDEP